MSLRRKVETEEEYLLNTVVGGEERSPPYWRAATKAELELERRWRKRKEGKGKNIVSVVITQWALLIVAEETNDYEDKWCGIGGGAVDDEDEDDREMWCSNN